MKDDYIIRGETGSITIEIEIDVLNQLRAISAHKGLSESELANTALKRFIAGHKDFLPPKAS